MKQVYTVRFKSIVPKILQLLKYGEFLNRYYLSRYI